MKKIILPIILFCQAICFGQCPPLPTNVVTGLLAYYPFNSGSINDFSGNNNHLSNTNGAIAVSDRNGNTNCAFEFVNNAVISQHLSTTNTTFLNELSAFSVSCWYKPLNVNINGSYVEALVNRDIVNNCDGIGRWSLGLYDCRRVVFARQNSIWENPPISSTSCESIVAANTGKWHHLTATYNQVGNTLKLYKDGVLQGVATDIANCGYNVVSNDIGDLFIGNRYTGVIDDIFIHNREISATEVTQL